MRHLQQKNTHIWFDEALIENVSSDIFTAEFWQKQNAVLGQAKGRGITWFVQTKALAAALRHYHRGGLLGKCIKDSYFFTGFANTRSAKEFALLRFLHQNGLAVPRPIAAKATRKGLVYRADILVEKIQGATDLVARLKQAPLPEKAYVDIGKLIAKMHKLQVCHSDLNIHNILQDEQGKFWLIDFDKCEKRAGESWKSANLERLQRSFYKEAAREKIRWQSEEWQKIMQGYDKIL